MKAVFISIFLCFLTSSFAQHLLPEWRFITGNVSQDEIFAITTDKSGSIISGGQFYWFVDMDPSANVHNVTMNQFHYEPDAFVQKLDANGNFLWAKSWANSNTGYQYWLRFDTPVIDSKGDIFLAITFKGKIDANPSISDSVIYDEPNQSIVYIKLNSSGDFISSHLLKSNSNYVRHGKMRLLNDKLYVYGSFRGQVDFDFGQGTSIKNTSGLDADAFILCTDTAFQFDWIKTHNTTISFHLFMSMDVANSGNIYTWFFSDRSSSINISPDPNNPFYLSSNITSYSNNLVISKLDSVGNLSWIKAMPFSSMTAAFFNDLELSSVENIAICGRIGTGDSLDCDPSINGEYWLKSSGDVDGILVELDSSGSFIGAAKYGSPNGDDRAWDVDYSVNDELYVGGTFTGTTDFDPTIHQETATAVGSAGDMYVMRVSSCPRQADTITVLSCTDYTMPNGSDVYSSSGIYLDGTFNTVKGCDSSIYIDLTVDSNFLSTSISQTNAGLITGKAGSSIQHQWFDCDNNLIISGAINDTFMPVVNGNYAAILSYSSCSDTTACYSINNVSIAENALPLVMLFPNPTSGLVQIETSSEIQKLQVVDLIGREILAMNKPNTQVDLSTLANGIYMVKVWFEEGVVVRRVVKE